MIKTLPNCVENSALLFPKKEAFRCGNLSLSYAELDKKTNQLAKHLVDSGIQKGDRVGIYMNRCIETAIAIYGILKSGAAYVPIDPISPLSRTQYLIDNCDIQFLISTQKQKKRISKILAEETKLKQVIGTSDETSNSYYSWESIYSTSLENYQKVNVLGEDLAYIIFTSGSTGAPKGIMHSHSSGLAYAKLSSELYQLIPEDRIANHAPLHFDISTFGYFSSPFASATTVIIPDAHTKLPVSLGNLIAEEKITVWYSVPLAISQLLISGVLDNYDFSAMRWVLFGGENFPIKYLKGVIQKWPQAQFSNVYGPAEVNQCTYYNFNSSSTILDHVPIGEIWQDTDYRILDRNDAEVSQGESGELVVHSTTMMMGYWNNKELTNNSMYTEIVPSNNEKKFYRTGDLVIQNKQDLLVFLGRKDRQVKLRGYRIELDDIEATINDHAEVKEAAVCILEKENNEKTLSAAVILTLDAQIENKELMAYCRSKLPSYAVPQSIDILDEFPRTGSGKIDLTQIKKVLIEL